MYNPYTKDVRIFTGYLVTWGIIALFHFLALYFIMEMNPEYAAVDSIISNLLYAFFGISFWYTSRFISFENSSLFRLLSNHFVSGVLASSMHDFLVYISLKKLFPEEQVFLSQALFWRFLFGLFIYFIIVSINYIIIYYTNFKEKALRESELNGLIKEAELKSLKYQINPHFIFNSLNSISSLTMFNPDAAREMTIKLSGFLRSTLSKNTKQMNILEDELNNVKLYLDIEKVRFEDKFDFIENINPECRKVKVPNMILQPLFENAIKYGVYETIEKIDIRISCRREGKYMKIIVENDYDPSVPVKKGEGIGLRNIRNRLELIYSQTNLLSTEIKNNKFIVNILIPFNEDE